MSRDRDPADRDPADRDPSDLTPEELLAMLGGAPFDPTLDPELARLEAQFDEEETPESELSEREAEQRRIRDETDWAAEADRAYGELLERVGEAQPEPRLHATRRACELLGDVHETFGMIHITGTNGKTSTARIAEALAGAAGSRTGMLSSPHLVRVTERIRIDGAPISDERFAVNWDDISPILELVDAELEGAGEPRLTFFEALTVLGYACFTDAGVEVGVVEVGMGGEWDSTNVADADVAVFTPIALDHQNRLGGTVGEIARTKAGIIKPGCAVVTAEQEAEALAELRRAAELSGATLLVEGEGFGVVSDQLAVGGRLVELRGIDGVHEAAPLRLIGAHQARNAALALAAVESFYGEPLTDDQVIAGLSAARSPGRLEVIGTEPTVVVDAAHNPHGAEHLAAALAETFAFDELVLVLGVLADKEVAGIARVLAPLATRIIVTASGSDRAIPAWELGERVREAIGDEAADEKGLQTVDDAFDAFEAARRDAAGRAREGVSTGVLITGSITLIGEAVALADEHGWRAAPSGDAPLEIGATDETGEAGEEQE